MQRFILGLAVALAALLGLAGCEPYALPPYQAYPYHAQPYPPPAWGPQAPAPRHLQDVEERIWRLTNNVRQQYGLLPLAWEGTLFWLSEAYSDDMLRRGFFSHTNPEGLTARERLQPYYSRGLRGWAENIWEGFNMSAADREALAWRIMNSWMSSPGHRQNILAPDYTHLGVGVAAERGEIRATQLFANLRS